MRQRTTFFHLNEDAIEPSSLKVEGRSIIGPDIKAVREDRFTLGLEELPADLQEFLRVTRELHLRWSSPFTYTSIGPWGSRTPPGLHVFYSPQSEEPPSSFSTDSTCRFLRSFVPVKDCSSPFDFFSRLPNDRFSHSTAYQGYLPMERLEAFVTYASQYACSPSDTECKNRLTSLYEADTFDVSYDAISHVVKITTMWKHKQQSLNISSLANGRIEVGLLTPDPAPDLETHEFGVTGLLTVLGENTEPAPTLFAFPSRHKIAGSSFSSRFLSPIGLHPTMQLLIRSGKPPMDDSFCSLHAYMTLPRAIFADRYQLEDSLFLASKNITALRYISQPVDLEAPDYVMSLWGSSVLLELSTPTVQRDEGFTVEVPLHLRYQGPQDGGEQPLEIPYPAVFWACAAEEGTKFPNSPFDRINLGYDGLFGPRTLFWHMDPVPEDGSKKLMLTGSVPVLDLKKSGSVSTITAAVVIVGFSWVAWKLLIGYLKTGYGSQKTTIEKSKKAQ